MNKTKIVKIPKHITFIYDSEKKIIIFIGPIETKTLKLKLKIEILYKINSIKITCNSFEALSNSDNKSIKSLQGTTIALIKKCFIETTFMSYGKLKTVGVGYRFFTFDNFNSKLLMFKLGYSHKLYFKVPEKLKIISLKFTKLFIYGKSYEEVSEISSLIRSYKKPEPYKGKGILYYNEKIILKEGKKV